MSTAGTVRDAGSPARRPPSAAVTATEPASIPNPRAEEPVAREPEPTSLTLTAYLARTLSHSIPVLIHSVRHQLIRQGGNPGDQVTIDLSAVPPVPACAPLLSLFGLVRRAVGSKPGIVVTGTSPALAACLVADLPDGVVVVGRTGSRWPG
jgi:hypothetical protein